MTYIARFIAWLFLFLAFGAWGGEALQSLDAGSYIFLTPTGLMAYQEPKDPGLVGDVLGFLILYRPLWLWPAIISAVLFLGVRRRRKKYMFRS